MQTHTRAALFLVLAILPLRAQVADTTPPKIKLLSPQEGSTQATLQVVVRVIVTDDTRVDRVTFSKANAKADVDAPNVYELTMTGREGRNKVTIEAWDAAGNRSELVLRFSCDTATAKAPEWQVLCGYSAAAPERGGLDVEEAPTSAEAALLEIAAAVGMVKAPSIVQGNVPNAAAAIRGNERVIIYNNAFLKQIKKETRNDWSFVSVLAHELGHHMNGHTITPGGSRPEIELEADETSGFIMAKLGASLEDAEAAMKALGDPVGSWTHPPRDKRLEAIRRGYAKGKPKTTPEEVKKPSDIEKKPEPKPEKKPCTSCRGSGRTDDDCGSCNGQGRLEAPCGVCQGRGMVACMNCSGFGRLRCITCGGTGTLFCVYGPCAGCGFTGALICGGCGGPGNVDCLLCDGGGVPCAGGCIRGRFFSTCVQCNGGGKVGAACGACNGKGVR